MNLTIFAWMELTHLYHIHHAPIALHQDFHKLISVSDKYRLLLCECSIGESRTENSACSCMFGVICFDKQGRATVGMFRVPRERFRGCTTLSAFRTVTIDVAPCIWVDETQLVWCDAHDLAILVM